jgi:DNA polymerase III delta prime subunit
MTFLEDTPEEAPKKEENSLWCEKFRPITLVDYIGNEHLKSKLAQYIDNQDVPHILLAGTAGTGKSSCAKLLVKSIKCDSIYINASDENSVETVRTKIKNFASSLGFNDLKIIILDEFDYFSPAAMAALRNLMETYSLHTRFILTCNYQERIIEPILSRCQSFQVVPPNKKDVARLLVKVLTAENVKFNTEAVVAIVQAHYPDIRAVLNVAQRGVINGELQLDKEAIMEGDVKSKVIELIKSSDKKQAFKDIRQLLADNSIRNFADFYSLLYEKVDEYAPKSQADVIMAIADAQFRDAAVVDKEINFCAGIINILNSIK